MRVVIEGGFDVLEEGVKWGFRMVSCAIRAA